MFYVISLFVGDTTIYKFFPVLKSFSIVDRKTEETYSSMSVAIVYAVHVIARIHFPHLLKLKDSKRDKTKPSRNVDQFRNKLATSINTNALKECVRLYRE